MIFCPLVAYGYFYLSLFLADLQDVRTCRPTFLIESSRATMLSGSRVGILTGDYEAPFGNSEKVWNCNNWSQSKTGKSCLESN